MKSLNSIFPLPALTTTGLSLYSVDSLQILYFLIGLTVKREGKKSENISKEKIVLEIGNEEQLGIDPLLLNKPILNKHFNSIFFLHTILKLHLPLKCVVPMSHCTIIPALLQYIHLHPSSFVVLI